MTFYFALYYSNIGVGPKRTRRQKAEDEPLPTAYCLLRWMWAHLLQGASQCLLQAHRLPFGPRGLPGGPVAVRLCLRQVALVGEPVRHVHVNAEGSDQRISSPK